MQPKLLKFMCLTSHYPILLHKILINPIESTATLPKPISTIPILMTDTPLSQATPVLPVETAFRTQSKARRLLDANETPNSTTPFCSGTGTVICLIARSTLQKHLPNAEIQEDSEAIQLTGVDPVQRRRHSWTVRSTSYPLPNFPCPSLPMPTVQTLPWQMC